MSDEANISVTEGHSDREGGCNACGRFVEATGPISHKVLQISLSRCSVRVCPECAKELLKRLALRVNQCCDVDLTVVVPDYEHEGDKYPGGIEPGVLHLNDIVALMRKYRRRPEVMEFLANLMET